MCLYSCTSTVSPTFYYYYEYARPKPKPSYNINIKPWPLCLACVVGGGGSSSIKIHMKTWNMHGWMGDINLQYHIYYDAHDNTDMLSYRHYSNKLTDREREREREREWQNKKQDRKRERERERQQTRVVFEQNKLRTIVPLVPKQNYDHTPKFEMFRATMLFGCILRTMYANASNGRERKKLTLVECTSP